MVGSILQGQVCYRKVPELSSKSSGTYQWLFWFPSVWAMSATLETDGGVGKEWISFHFVWPAYAFIPPSIRHTLCRMLCIQRWIKVASRSKQLPISKPKREAHLASNKKRSPIKEIGLFQKVLHVEDNGAGHRRGKFAMESPSVCALCSENGKTHSQRCF